MATTLKEINLLEGQVAKDLKKVDAASSKKAAAAQAKASESERSLSQTLEIWETEAPFAFEAYQRVDEQRLNLLRETVAKFETAQSDAAQRLMNITEQTMQIALNFDTQAEMTEFLLKNATAPGGAAPTRSGRATRESTPAPAAPSRSQMLPPVTPARSRSNGGPATGEFGAASSSASIHSAGGPPSAHESTPGRGSTLKSALTRIGRGRSNKSSNAETTTTYGALPERAEAMGPPSDSRITSRAPRLSLSGGDRPSSSRREENTSSAGLMAPMLPDVPSVNHSRDVSSRGAGCGVMNSHIPHRQSTLGRSPAPLVDSEGYSIPPPDRKPWEAGGAGAPAGASLMDDDEDEQEQVADL